MLLVSIINIQSLSFNQQILILNWRIVLQMIMVKGYSSSQKPDALQSGLVFTGLRPGA